MARAGVAALPPGPVDEAAWLRLRRDLPEVSERTLRTAVRESGRPLAPVVEGVRQDSLAHLKRTLSALSAEYQAAAPPRRRALRALVITAKTHASLAARSSRLTPEKHALKVEIALWIRAWLFHPALFPTWAELRERQASGSSSTATN
jgi:hypothetical protein